MKYEDFHGLPPAKKLAPVILLTGDERFFKEEAIREIEVALGPRVERVEVRAAARGGPEPGALLDDARTPSLFAPKKLVLVREAQHLIADRAAALAEIAGHPAAGAVLVLDTTGFDRRTKAAKELEKAVLLVEAKPLFAEPPPWVKGGRPWDSPLVDWVVRRARQRGKALSPENAYRLVQLTGNDLFEIAATLEKLDLLGGAFAGEGGRGAVLPSSPAVERGGRGAVLPSSPAVERGGRGAVLPSSPAVERGGRGAVLPSSPAVERGGRGAVLPSSPAVGAIDAEDIEAVAGHSRRDDAFAVADAIGKRDAAAALAALDRLFRNGLEDRKGAVITDAGTIALIIGSRVHAKMDEIRRTLAYLAAGGARRREAVAEALAIPPFLADRALASADRFAGADLARAFKDLLEADLAVKGQGPPPRAALERLALKLCGLARGAPLATRSRAR